MSRGYVGKRSVLLFAVLIGTLSLEPARSDNLFMDCASLASQPDAAACERVQALLRNLAQAKAAERPENRSLPVDLKCPTASGGIIDFLQKSPSGISIRTRVTFDAAKAVFIDGEILPSGRKQWISIIKGDMADLNDPGDATRLRNNIDLTSRLRTDVCLGPPSVRDSFFRGLAANKASLEAR